MMYTWKIQLTLHFVVATVRYVFLNCPNYDYQRITLMQTVSRFCAITLDTLLYGKRTLSLQANSDNFEAVQLFLEQINIF